MKLKKLLYICILLIVIVALPANSKLNIASKTAIPIIFIDTIDSSNPQRKGDVAVFRIAENIYDNGTLIFREGSKGYLKILQTHKKGRLLPKAGKINLGKGFVKSIDGQIIKVYPPREEDQIKGRSIAKSPVFWGSLVVWPLKLVPKTRNASIKPGMHSKVLTE